MKTEILATVYNEDLGTAAVVADIGKAYSVALFDVDAEAYVLGGCIVYPKTMAGALDLAFAKAATL